MYYCYILYSPRLDRYYVGSTQDLQDRLARHNAGRSKYTKVGIPWELVYQESFDTRTEAYQREREIKRQKSRKYIQDLIASLIGLDK